MSIELFMGLILLGGILLRSEQKTRFLQAEEQANRLDEKLDLLLEERGIFYDPTARARRLEAIEAYRKETGASLRDAELHVDGKQADEST